MVNILNVILFIFLFFHADKYLINLAAFQIDYTIYIITVIYFGLPHLVLSDHSYLFPCYTV